MLSAKWLGANASFVDGNSRLTYGIPFIGVTGISIKEKLMPIGEDVTFHCGHGPSGTLGYEARTNPFLLDPERFKGMM